MHQQKIDNNLIVNLSIDLSLAAILYCEELETAKKFVIARQLLKSATSIGANVMEAQNAESKIDFIHKMKIADKEADETLYWLTLCELSPSILRATHYQHRSTKLPECSTQFCLKVKRTFNLQPRMQVLNNQHIIQSAHQLIELYV